MLTPPIPLSYLLYSLTCLLWPLLLMSSTRASPTTRSPCWRGSFKPRTSSARRLRDHLGAALSVVTPPTSSPTALRERSSTPPTSMTTTTEMTKARVTIRRSTASGTRRRRSFKRSCPEHVLNRASLTSPVMTPPAQRRMRRSSASKATSPAFASWENLQETSPTPM
jgi:hypothetical protein